MAGGELAGTVTFLLTDIVGSTQLWEQDGAAMAAAMVVHDKVVDEAVVRCGGTVVRPRGEGDSRFAVFGRASDAAAAAVGVMAGLQAATWVTAEPIQVRAGLHTGEVEVRDGDYYGTAVNLCARLRGLAHPSQVLVSETTARLIRATPPAGVSVRDVGVHRLKGLRNPERVFQLCHTDLDDDFPTLVSEDTPGLPVFRRPGNRTLVGRSGVVEAVSAALESARLVCLVGPGGVGKTSIADQVARAADDRREVVCFVDLTLIRDGGLVAAVVGTALGMRSAEAGIELADVVDVLAERELLLYIDNCEHLIDAAANLVDAVLRGCPGVHILATSREPLDLVDEVVVTVDSLTDDDAVELFTIRARAADPTFNPGTADRDALIQICQSVDGLPLGIELVSARVRALTPSAILEQLNVLRVERRGATPRHHSLDSAIAWSYELLNPTQQAVLRRLSVFHGGADIPAAVKVCADEPEGVVAERAVVEHLHALVARSLVVADRSPDGVRFRLLETVRAFAGEQLEAAGEGDVVRGRLVRWTLDWAASIRRQIEGPDPAPAVANLVREEANIRAAYAACRDSGDDKSLVRLVGAFGPFALGSSGVVAEVDEWIERALAVEDTPPDDLLPLLLVAIWRLDRPTDDLAEQARALAVQTGDLEAQMFAMAQAGEKRLEEAAGVALLQQAIALGPQANHPVYLAAALNALVNVLLRRRALGEARRLLEESFAGGSTRFGLGEPMLIYQAGRAALMAGDLDGAEVAFNAAENAAERTASPIGRSYALFGRALLAFERGDLAAARQFHEEAFEIDLLADRGELPHDYYSLAKICAAQGDLDGLDEYITLLEAASVALTFARPHLDLARGMAALAKGRADDAESRFRAAIEPLVSIPMVDSVAEAIAGLAACATARGDEARASVLSEPATGLRDGSRAVDSVASVIA